MEKSNIIILSPKDEVPEMIRNIVEKDDYVVSYAHDFEETSELYLQKNVQIILIDMSDDNENGFELCRKLKENFETRRAAIALFTDTATEDQVIRALESGADELFSSRFTERELKARLNALVRRIEDSGSKKIKVKDLIIDLDEHRVRKQGKSIDLTYIQFKLLYLLASRRDNVFSRQEILDRVWGRKVYVTNRTVDVHIKRLREKLGEYKYPSQYIETIHGTGYRFL
ncbi:response regulator transcription factor [bacterium]|nr:response regulator transcription factor [bacterium]